MHGLANRIAYDGAMVYGTIHTTPHHAMQGKEALIVIVVPGGNTAGSGAAEKREAVGANILREHHDLPATISAGWMALMVDGQRANVVVYGRDEEGVFVNDENAFHAWVECDGWLIDFMAPIMGVALRQDGVDWPVPCRMLQKRLSDRKNSLGEVQHVG